MMKLRENKFKPRNCILLVAALFISFPLIAVEREIVRQQRLKHVKELLGRRYHKKNNYLKDAIKYRLSVDIIQYMTEKLLQRKWRKYSKKIATSIVKEARKNQFDPFFIMAIIASESGFRLDAVGTSGELGLMQIMPSTGKWFAKKLKLPWKGKKSLKDPTFNIMLGAKYMFYLREKFDNHGQLYLAAYNMGPTNVKKALKVKVYPKDYAFLVMQKYLKLYKSFLKIQKSPSTTFVALR